MRLRQARPTTDPASRRRVRPRWLVLVVLSLVLLGAACRRDTTTMGAVRQSTGALIGIEGSHGGAGTMGVDLLLGGDYNPCHEQWDAQAGQPYNDTFYGACIDSRMGRTSYYRAVPFRVGGPEISSGVLFGNADWNSCQGQWWCPKQDGLLMHGWADKATGWALEFYPQSPNEGGVRIEGGFPTATADGKAWTGPLGAMRPILANQPNTFRLTGWVNGSWPDDRWEIQAFQMPPYTQVTSAFYPEQGFSLTRNRGSSFTSWPMIAGDYKLYIWDNATGEHFILRRWLGPGSSIVLTPGAPCFGLSPAMNASEQPAC